MTTQKLELIGTLKRLYATCKDGENGYRRAARHVKQEDVKRLFQGYAEQRNQYAVVLQGELERLGTRAHKSGTIAEALHQGWTGIKSAVTGGSDKALVAECERAEDAAEKHFEEALKQPLPTDVQRARLASMRRCSRSP